MQILLRYQSASRRLCGWRRVARIIQNAASATVILKFGR